MEADMQNSPSNEVVMGTSIGSMIGLFIGAGVAAAVSIPALAPLFMVVCTFTGGMIGYAESYQRETSRLLPYRNKSLF